MRFPSRSIALASLLVGLAWPALAADEEPAFEGVYACQKCHSMPDASKQTSKGRKRAYLDDAYDIWKKSPHAHAYESLKSEEALATAAKLGVDDPQTDERCVKCHVTGWGVPEERLGKFYALDESVTCEACHGPGSEYKRKKVHADDYELALTVGFNPLAEREEVEKVCVTCHNDESPTYEPDYMDHWYEWQHPETEIHDGVRAPAKKDRGDWVPKPDA